MLKSRKYSMHSLIKINRQCNDYENYILVNGIKWNYEALVILINRQLYDENLLNEEDSIPNYEEVYLELRVIINGS
jgi:hypothetical protein